MDDLYRIKPAVRPYGGKRLRATEINDKGVKGWVIRERSRTFKDQRFYYHHELEKMA